MRFNLLIAVLFVLQFARAQQLASSKEDTTMLHYGDCNTIALPNNIKVDSITASSGRIENISTPNQFWLCELPLSVKKSTLYYWTNGKVVLQEIKKIEPLKPAEIMYIGCKGGFMSAAQIKAGQGINGYRPWGGCSLYILIQSYTVTRHAADGSVTSAKCIGPALSTDAKKIMKMAVIGDKFTFSDIKFKDHTNKVNKHPAFTITTK